MIDVNIYITIVITWIFFIWPGPARMNDRAPGEEQAAPGRDHHNTPDLAPEQPRTGSEPDHETSIGEDDIRGEGQAVGEAVNNVVTEVLDEEEIISVGIDTVTDVSLYPAEHETVGVSEANDEADLGPGERPPAASRWTRVRTRLAHTPGHWTCDRVTCRRCEEDRLRRTQRHQFDLIQLRSLD